MSRETEDLVCELLKRSYTKTTLSIALGVTWDDVDDWFNGRSEPSLEQIADMGKLLHDQARPA